MMRALFTGASGMRAQQFKIDVTSNNLANANSTGFKADRAEFTDLLYQQIRRPGGTSATGIEWPTPLQVGLGADPIATAKLHTQGGYMATDQPLDMLIEGDGFFQIDDSQGGIVYTRDGSFKLDSEGNIVNHDGFYIEPAITVPQETQQLLVMSDGTMIATMADGSEEELGQITTARFVNPQGLESIGSNYYRETGASGAPIVNPPMTEGHGAIKQGYLEMSNVSVVDELVSLIVGQRAYEANSRSVQTSDEMLQTAVNLKR